jgi:hypothetical protein
MACNRQQRNQVPGKQVDGKEGTAVLLPFFAKSSRLHLLAASASVLLPLLVSLHWRTGGRKLVFHSSTVGEQILTVSKSVVFGARCRSVNSFDSTC